MASLVRRLNQARDDIEIPRVPESGNYDYRTFFLGLEAQLAGLEESSNADEREMARCYCMLAVFREDLGFHSSSAGASRGRR